MADKPLFKKTKQLPKKRGRPRFRPPEWDKVEGAAAVGADDRLIAQALGYDLDRLKKRPEWAKWRATVDTGRARGAILTMQRLAQLARDGNVAALIFTLKARHGWQEGSNLNIKLEDVRSMSDEQLRAIIDGRAAPGDA